MTADNSSAHKLTAFGGAYFSLLYYEWMQFSSSFAFWINMYVSSAAVVKKRGADAKSQIVDATGDSRVTTV